MPKTREEIKIDSGIPKNIRNLIVRKLRQKRRELDNDLFDAKRKAHSNLKERILANIRTGSVGQAFVSAPLAAFEEIATGVTCMTEKWPRTVWETILPAIQNAKPTPTDLGEVHALLNDFAWPAGRPPFTLGHIDPAHIKEHVNREYTRYGGIRSALQEAFERQLKLAAAASKVAVLNAAKQAREKVGIDIDEHAIFQSHLASKESPLKITNREIRKQKTQEMYASWRKKYRALKKKNPNKSDKWCAIQISKLDIAQNGSAETIRRNMK